MNLILLDSPAPLGEFSREDRRYTHIRRILHGKVGSTLKAGVKNGPLGTLEILALTDHLLRYRFVAIQDPDPPYTIEVILGAMRPIVAKRLLKDLTALGVKGIHLVKADLSEGSYLQSSLWKNKEYETYLWEGAEQGGTTLIPVVHLYTDLKHYLHQLSAGGLNLVMDPRSPKSLFSVQLEWERTRSNNPLILVAVGPERGWTEREMELFHQYGFVPCRMGTRILRTEASALIAVGILVTQWEEG